MTAHTPPTPPAMRDRKLESVCFEASTTSVLTSSAEGIEAGEDDEEEEDIVHAKRRKKDDSVEKNEGEWELVIVMALYIRAPSCGIVELDLRTASRGTIFAKPAFSPGSLLPLPLPLPLPPIFPGAIPTTNFEHHLPI